MIDLHTHTTASDGSLTPAELIALADRTNLAAIAVTDHDTLAGLADARAAADDCPDLRLAVGVEVSAIFPGGTMHILGLGIDEAAPSVNELLGTLAQGRRERNPKIVAKLNELGLAIEMNDVVAIAAEQGGTAEIISRNHIAEALVRLGHVAKRQDAFDRYLASGCPAYVDRTRLAPADTLAAIHEADGVAVLCHPPQLKYQNDAHLETIVRELMDHGLDGLEAYHSDCSDQQTRHYIDLAKRLGLAVVKLLEHLPGHQGLKRPLLGLLVPASALPVGQEKQLSVDGHPHHGVGAIVVVVVFFRKKLLPIDLQDGVEIARHQVSL